MFAIEKMCKVLKVSRSGYYEWLVRKPSTRKEKKQNDCGSYQRDIQGK